MRGPRQYKATATYFCPKCGHRDTAMIVVEEGTAAIWADVECSRCCNDDLDWTVE